jgi:ketosteroid isomerase-like protein
MADDDQISDILDCEGRRCAALTAGDVETLAELVSDDLVHIHGSGQVDGKQAYLDGVRSKYIFHQLTRGELNIRLYGDIAVVVGPVSQIVELRATGQRVDVNGIASQTWVRDGGRWRQNTCHMHFLS